MASSFHGSLRSAVLRRFLSPSRRRGREKEEGTSESTAARTFQLDATKGIRVGPDFPIFATITAALRRASFARNAVRAPDSAFAPVAAGSEFFAKRSLAPSGN